MRAVISCACALLSVALTTACGSGSSFSGGGSKEKPAKKSDDARAEKEKEKEKPPVRKPEKKSEKQETTPFPEDEKGDVDLGNDTVVPETPPEDIKLPEKTVVKGSFRVWTIPADPEPLMAYDIYIDVKLPSNVSTYSRNDLSGRVVGTDGYDQPIGRDALAVGIKSQRFESYLGRATLIISVPGALNLVKDTINIRSDLLSESQSIEIVF